MKHILIQHSKKKFIQNCLSLSLDNYTIIDIAIGNNLYQTYFRHKPAYCLFTASNLSSEVVQFCEDYGDKTNVYMFCDTEDSCTSARAVLDKNIPITYIGQGKDAISIPSNLINDKLFFNNNNTNRKDSIVCFMDEMFEMPSKLIELLYPNTKIPIKLFNCSSIKHYQNLGVITEKNRALLLQTNKYYLDMGPYTGNSYVNEALACGSIPISLEDLSSNNYHNQINTQTNPQLLTYTNFLRDTLKL